MREHDRNKAPLMHSGYHTMGSQRTSDPNALFQVVSKGCFGALKEDQHTSVPEISESLPEQHDSLLWCPNRTQG